tara:strand:- start:304 stop:501 length:198 start_codon:yes stop_codon:yes gene_type:complete
MEKKDKNKWTNKFRALGKKKGSRQDFIKLYKEMKNAKEGNKDYKDNHDNKTEKYSWKDLIKDSEK